MRQPEVAGRSLLLGLALLLALPVLPALGVAVTAAAFLAEFLGAGRWLSALTPAARRDALSLPGAAADRYQAPALRPGAPLVLVHGFAPRGKDDPRVRQAGRLLARAGFTVLVPTIPGLTAGRLRPADAEPVVAALAAAPGRAVALVAVSVGAGPALLAAADPRVADRVSVALTLGGYASAAELLRFFLTGDYAFGDLRGRVEHDPEVVSLFVNANADLIAPPVAAALAGRQPAAVRAFLDDPPPAVRALLDGLSPERVARRIRARLILVHGRNDPAVPYTESLRLAAARPERTRVVLLGLVDHVEGPGRAPRGGGPGDLLALWTVVYGLLRQA